MTESKNKIRFAVVGLGHIGKRHADMVAHHEQCVLAAVVDIDSATKDIYDAPFFESINDFLASDIEVEVVCIATPNGLHAQQATKLLAAGCHVIIEKPIALTTVDCDLIIEAAKKNNKKVFCVMQNRYSEPVKWLKELVSSGILGEIYMVHTNCFWNRDDRYYSGNTWHGTKDIDGGTLYTQFSHYVDLLFWLFGDLTDIQARFSNNNHKEHIEFEDSAMINFEFLNGGAGTLNYTTSVYDKNMESSMVVISEHGTIKLGGQYMQDVEYCHVKGGVSPDFIKNELSVAGYSGAKANHWYVIQNVVDVLQKDEDIATTVQEGKKIVNIIEQVYALKK